MREQSPSHYPIGFSIQDVCLAVGRAPDYDVHGRSHLTFSAAELSIEPGSSGDRTAACWWWLVDQFDVLVDRRLPLPTEGASLLARFLLGLGRYREDPDLPDEVRAIYTGNHCTAAQSFPFDDPTAHPSARALLANVGVNIVADESIRAAISDVLHLATLARQFPHAQVYEARRGGGICVAFPGVLLQLSKGRRVKGFVKCPDVQRFDLTPANVALLLAVSSGIAYVGIAKARFPERVAAFTALRTDLLELLREVRQASDESDVPAGYRRLVELFDPEGWPTSVDTAPLGQLNAVATMAALRWMARRGTARPERRVDLAQVAALAGCQRVEHGGEHLLSSRQGNLLLQHEGDLVIGRGRLVVGAGRMVSTPIALAADALTSVGWALGGLDVVAPGAASRLLRAYVRDAFVLPGHDPRSALPPLLAKLSEIANGGGSGAVRVAELLERRPGD